MNPMPDEAPSPPASASLAPLLHDARIGWDELEDRYGALLRLVETVLGVVPNCDRYLEIWPPAFRTYNILVPNFLNLPVPIFGLGGPPPDVVGLAMYVASRTAECPASPVGRPAESAALALARAASASPAQIDAATVEACRRSGLPPAAIIETITWLSVLQMLHRLTCYATVHA